MARLFTNKPHLTWLVLLTALFLLAACGPAENDSPNPPSTTEAPAPPTAAPATAVPSDTAYPPPPAAAPANEAYPAPPDNSGKTRLAFDQPVDLTQTTVTGVGPPGLPVFILNVTLMGSELGVGVVDSDGTFAVPVSALQPGTRIGLTADLSSIGLSENDVYGGDGAIAMPQVGNFYDSFVIPQN